MQALKQLLQRAIFRYAIVGALGTLLHFALLILLVEAFGMHPATASAAGFIVVLIVSYGLNKRWTFNQPASRTRRGSFVRYAIVSGAGLLLNTFIMYAGVEWAAASYMLCQALVTVVVPVHNYLLNKYWTFRTVPGDAASP